MSQWSFGIDVALDGDTALVGAHAADIAGTDDGTAYVFVRQGDMWVEEAQLLPSDPDDDDRFGFSVALQGDTAVVGAVLGDSEGEMFQGALYVFSRAEGVWTQTQKLMASDGAAQDRLGWSVALDGDTILAGAVFADNSQGAAYVFVNHDGVWEEEQKLVDVTGSDSATFGRDVALQGDTALIGAPLAETPPGVPTGASFVFTRAGGVWTLEQELVTSDAASPDLLGWSVSLDGDLALMGAQQKMIDGNLRQGAAYIFRRSGNTWTEEQRLVASDGHAEANFGTGTALKGRVALVGAEFNFPGDQERGVVYEYRLEGSSWQEIQKFAAPIGQEFDSFGRSIALTSDRALISNKDNILVDPHGTAWVFGRPVLFEDGFEAGDTSLWSQTVP